jgi:hypothetical protein
MSILFEIRSRRNRPSKIIFLFVLYAKKILRIGFEKSKLKKPPRIDIVIPTVSKDFKLIDDVIGSFSKLNHEINKIYIVAPQNQEIIEYCASHNLNFVDERTILGYGKEVIDYKVNGVDRSGWMLQQMIKLSGEKIVEMDNYFILDSDTIIADNFSLIENGKWIFYQNEEWHDYYFETFQKMFGYKTKNRLSFTSHMMIFNKEVLRTMKKELETKHARSWDQVYLSTIDINEASCVSDYDTYANYVLCNYPDRFIQKPLYNRAFSRNMFDTIKSNLEKYSKKYKTISFHSYIK